MPHRIACLGPEGSFSHLIATKRFPDTQPTLLASVEDVFTWLADQPESDAQAQGIVPIENSSGGIILATIDRLMDPRCPFHVQEELTLDVKLALLGRPDQTIEVIYSHYMPFFHCDDWLKQNHPHARRVPVASTSHAAERAAREPNAAAIGSRENAERHNLALLQYPIEENIINITQFFLIGHQPAQPSTDNNRTALVVELPDKPGILCSFLTPFSEAAVSLKRIESRPVRGQPNTYRFYIEIEGSPAHPAVATALERANTIASRIHQLGSYPTGIRFES
ncbi:ACT domain-containing protein [Phragmitibacter flavus]|uniref:prephenate dehydratase n=1 Tax=Phragmitibacter flavus TaxID=2576071 RepID=A0A5R8KFW1_9BACT|nr:prephenate dehydratase domain-containing protein [Phragmitibacter flavus]TLD71180.1 ACT domain-containing protein [Phragmitibacter flavus]